MIVGTMTITMMMKNMLLFLITNFRLKWPLLLELPSEFTKSVFDPIKWTIQIRNPAVSAIMKSEMLHRNPMKNL
jgi:hypothetical protein